MAALYRRFLNNSIRRFPNNPINKVHILLTSLTSLNLFPHAPHHPLIAQNFENTITSQHNKIVEILPHRKMGYFGRGYYYAFFAAVFGVFGGEVAEGAGDGEAAGEDAVGADGRVAFLLVDLASVFDDSFNLSIIMRHMIPTQLNHLLPMARGHDSPTIAHISHVNLLVHDQHNNRATPAPVPLSHRLRHKLPLGLQAAE